MIIPLKDMKKYLRVEYEDDDALIRDLENAAEKLVADILRADNINTLKKDDFVRTAVMYATAYFYEHREEADHEKLTTSLKYLLSGIRGVVF